MEQRSGTERGTGEVHSHIADEPYKGRAMSGKYHPGQDGQGGQGAQGAMGGMKERASDAAQQVMDRAGGTAQHLVDEASDRAHGALDRAEEKAGELRDRAEDALSQKASQAREQAGELMDRAESTIEERTHAISTARQYPLAALGIAFGVGFLLAGSGDEGRKGQGRHRGALSSAKDQVKGALMGGVSAAVSQQLRSYVEEQGGVSGLMDRFTGGSGNGASRTAGMGAGA